MEADVVGFSEAGIKVHWDSNPYSVGELGSPMDWDAFNMTFQLYFSWCLSILSLLLQSIFFHGIVSAFSDV